MRNAIAGRQLREWLRRIVTAWGLTGMMLAPIPIARAQDAQPRPSAPIISQPSTQAPVSSPSVPTTPAIQLSSPSVSQREPTSVPEAVPPSNVPATGEAGSSRGAAVEPRSMASPVNPTLASLPRDMSPWSMFLNADIIVKVVMVGLAFASLVTWTVWLAKGLELFAAKRKARSAARKLERADSLAQATREIEGGWTRSGPIADLVQAAVRETKRSDDLSSDGIKERLAIALSRIEARAGRNMARGTGLLATIGATAPFVGLFGTVWGIMNSFIGISQSHTTNLAVVAPGIAEALLATAIGLVAAIPAVIIYNVFARAITGYRALLSDASGEVLQHLSRDLERRERHIKRDAADRGATSAVHADRPIPRTATQTLRSAE